jgi:signal transduction histidine kinase
MFLNNKTNAIQSETKNRNNKPGNGKTRSNEKENASFVNHYELFYKISSNLLKLQSEKFDEEIINEIGTIASYTNSEACLLLLFDETKTIIAKLYKWHFNEYSGPKFDDFLQNPQAINTLYLELKKNKVIFYNKDTNDGNHELFTKIRNGLKLSDAFLLPLIHNNDVIGVIGFANFVSTQAIPSESIYLLDLFGNLIVNAYIKILNEDKLKAMILEKDKFFGIIAHDLRGPFTGLIGITETLAKEFVNLSLSEIRSYSNALYSSSLNVFRLLENLLEWSRLQRGIIKYSPINLNLRNTVLSTTYLLKNNAENKNISVKIEIPDNLYVYADEVMLESILRNLLENAVKFTDNNGEIFIEGKQETDWVSVSVKDNGTGMSSEFLEGLFSYKELISHKGTSNEKGSGLGLILCKEFVEKNNGNISVKSKPGKGSTFTFTLPIGKSRN